MILCYDVIGDLVHLQILPPLFRLPRSSLRAVCPNWERTTAHARRLVKRISGGRVPAQDTDTSNS